MGISKRIKMSRMQQKAFVGCCCPSFLLLFLSNAADTRWIMLGKSSSLTSWCVFPEESALNVPRSVFICLHRSLCILVDHSPLPGRARILLLQFEIHLAILSSLSSFIFLKPFTSCFRFTRFIGPQVKGFEFVASVVSPLRWFVVYGHFKKN